MAESESAIERAPRLRAVQVEAETIREAIEKARGLGTVAGKEEMMWALSNPEKAIEMLGDRAEFSKYYFQVRSDGDVSPASLLSWTPAGTGYFPKESDTFSYYGIPHQDWNKQEWRSKSSYVVLVD